MLAFNIIHWVEMHELACPVKKLVNIDCPGCGLQRSVVELLKGNVQSSFNYHPATIPLLLFFLFCFSHLIWPVKNGNKIIVCSYLFVVTIVFTNYIYKIIHLL